MTADVYYYTKSSMKGVAAFRYNNSVGGVGVWLETNSFEWGFGRKTSFAFTRYWGLAFCYLFCCCFFHVCLDEPVAENMVNYRVLLCFAMICYVLLCFAMLYAFL